MPNTTHRTYTMAQIKRANRDAGQHWFSPDSMRFFGSRLAQVTYGPDSAGTVYFVSNEQRGFDASSGRAYSVRTFDPSTGKIGTYGEFLEHETLAQAHKAAREAARS